MARKLLCSSLTVMLFALTGSESDVRIGPRFRGLLDEVRLYERALSEQEIAVLYKLESSHPAPE